MTFGLMNGFLNGKMNFTMMGSKLIPTAIITTPRKVSYISQSIGTYCREFDFEPHVFCEPGAEKFANRYCCQVHVNEKKQGIIKNWVQALYHLAEYLPFVDRVMICEDDIEWTVGSGYKLNVFDPEPFSFISPYCSLANGYGKVSQWVEARMVEGRGWCGALAICMSRGFVRYLLNHLHDFLNYAQNLYLDYAIGQCALDYGRPIYTHVPTLVYHLGEVSSLMDEIDPRHGLIVRRPYEL